MAVPFDEMRRKTFMDTPLFAALAAEERMQIAALAVEKSYGAGEALFFEGMACEGLFVIGAGRVKIVKTSPSGREIMLASDTAPASVAEVPLFDDGVYPATVVAVEPTTAYLVRKDEFRRFCREHPEVPLKVLMVMGRRLRQLVSLIEAVTFGSVRQRLAKLLLEASETEPGGRRIVPLTHEELSLRLGTVREVVSRNLARFQSEGGIRMVRRQIEIADARKLREEAEIEY